MIIKVIIAQRKESYEGEFAPETLECITEFNHEDNPSWLISKFNQHLKENHWESVKVIDLKVPQNVLVEILRPSPSTISAEVRESKDTQ